MSRKVTTGFNAFRLLNELSCRELEGCDLDAADVPFKAGDQVLNVTFANQGQTVNGIPVVQFTSGLSSYCVKKSVFEESTEPANS